MCWLSGMQISSAQYTCFTGFSHGRIGQLCWLRIMELEPALCPAKHVVVSVSTPPCLVVLVLAPKVQLNFCVAQCTLRMAQWADRLLPLVDLTTLSLRTRTAVFFTPLPKICSSLPPILSSPASRPLRGLRNFPTDPILCAYLLLTSGRDSMLRAPWRTLTWPLPRWSTPIADLFLPAFASPLFLLSLMVFRAASQKSSPSCCSSRWCRTNCVAICFLRRFWELTLIVLTPS